MYNPIFDFDEISCLYWQSIYRSLLGYIVPYDVPSSAVISFVSDGEIVLIKRKNTNFLSLPGGEITWGETIRKNVRRKLAIQTGLELVKIKHTAGLYFPTDNSQTCSLTEVVVAEVRGEIKIKDSTEVAEARLFNLDNLPAVEQPILN